MNIPKHIAIIPDGNRRWAKAQNLNPWDGHTEGVKRFWEIGDVAYKAGVTHLTFWGASYDNLVKRSKPEINFLLDLLGKELAKPEVRQKLHTNQTRFEVIGEWQTLTNNKSLADATAQLEQETAHYEKNVLTILFGYDGQREMLEALNLLIKSGEDASEDSLRKYLWTGALPEVDFLIRTGGEPHWSAGFMMWLVAHAQLYFTDQLWPDFKEENFNASLEEYASRERRMGK
jgi:undecaprenyl diphosphate synthase